MMRLESVQMIAWQVSYEGEGLVIDNRTYEFWVGGYLMANDLKHFHEEVIRHAMDHPIIRQHAGDPSSLIFNAHEIYERPDLGNLEIADLDVCLDSR